MDLKKILDVMFWGSWFGYFFLALLAIVFDNAYIAAGSAFCVGFSTATIVIISTKK